MPIIIQIENQCPICKQLVEHFEEKKNVFVIYCTNQKCKYERELRVIKSVV